MNITASSAAVPAPTAALHFQTQQQVARTHRGEYYVHFIRDDSEHSGRAWASWHDYAGDHCLLGPVLGEPNEVRAACGEHAAAQSPWPAMLGWPADGDLEVLEVLS